MDFPGVTTVLQVGLPANGEQYVHRLGRTARAGQSPLPPLPLPLPFLTLPSPLPGAGGSGILILAPFETFFLRKREITLLPLAPHPLAASSLAIGSPALANARELVRRAMLTVDDETKSQHYGASLGFYKSFLRECFGGAEGMVQVSSRRSERGGEPSELSMLGADRACWFRS